jgi:hypothetical protein
MCCVDSGPCSSEGKGGPSFWVRVPLFISSSSSIVQPRGGGGCSELRFDILSAIWSYCSSSKENTQVWEEGGIPFLGPTSIDSCRVRSRESGSMETTKRGMPQNILDILLQGIAANKIRNLSL